MVFLMNLILALLIGLLLAAVLFWGLGRRAAGPTAGFLFLVTILFLSAWVGSIWIQPTGPELWGIPWAAMILIGLIFALVIAAVTSPEPREPIAPDQEGVAPPTATGGAAG